MHLSPHASGLRDNE